jgi:hypothetical protein
LCHAAPVEIPIPKEISMSDYGLFIGYGFPARNREREAIDAFNAAVGLWTSLQERGEIESWEAIFLEPHGGDLGGFFFLRGEAENLGRVRGSDEFARVIVQAQLSVDNVGVVGAEFGGRVGAQLAMFQEAVAKL